MIEVTVESIRVNMTNYKRVVMLKEKDGPRHLPIWTGHFEADAISIPMQNVAVSRPMTHDLLVGIIPQMGGRWMHALIHDLQGETFYAKLIVELSEDRLEVDARPSDAVAVAIRAGIPIYVEDEVFDRAGMVVEEKAGAPEEGAPGADVRAEEVPSAQESGSGSSPSGEARPAPRDRFDRFTERARKVMELAQEEARRFSHNFIGPEHLLLGLARDGEGVAAKVLANLGVELNKVRLDVECAIGRGDRTATVDLGLTPRTKKVIELAVDEARRLNHH